MGCRFCNYCLSAVIALFHGCRHFCRSVESSLEAPNNFLSVRGISVLKISDNTSLVLTSDKSSDCLTGPHALSKFSLLETWAERLYRRVWGILVGLGWAGLTFLLFTSLVGCDFLASTGLWFIGTAGGCWGADWTGACGTGYTGSWARGYVCSYAWGRGTCLCIGAGCFAWGGAGFGAGLVHFLQGGGNTPSNFCQGSAFASRQEAFYELLQF